MALENALYFLLFQNARLPQLSMMTFPWVSKERAGRSTIVVQILLPNTELLNTTKTILKQILTLRDLR